MDVLEEYDENGEVDITNLEPIGVRSNEKQYSKEQYHILNNAKTSCSYNVNYIVEFGYDVPVFDFGIPVKYNKPTSDYLIVYY